MSIKKIIFKIKEVNISIYINVKAFLLLIVLFSLEINAKECYKNIVVEEEKISFSLNLFAPKIDKSKKIIELEVDCNYYESLTKGAYLSNYNLFKSLRHDKVIPYANMSKIKYKLISK